MATDTPWWEANGSQLAAYIKELMEQDAYRRRTYLQSLSAYHKKPRGKRGRERALEILSSGGGTKNPANLVKNITNSLLATITHTKPLPSVVTRGGDLEMQERAKKMTGFTGAVIKRSKAHHGVSLIVRDAMLGGTGVGRVRSYIDPDKIGRVVVERVLPWEVLVDEKDGYYNDPMSMHYVRFMPTAQLIKKYPKHKDTIEASVVRFGDDVSEIFTTYSLDRDVAYTMLIESWRRASESGAPGVHIVAVDGAILGTEKWTSKLLPFFWYHWTEPTSGFWGDSLVQEIGPLDREFNEVLTKVARTFYANGVSRISYEKGSIDPKDITNQPDGSMIPRSVGSQPPVQLTQALLPQEMYAHLDRLGNLIYDVSGASQMNAQSKKPAGLVSGRAITEFNDIETRRFVLKGQEYEEVFLRIGTLIVEESKRLEAGGIPVEMTSVMAEKQTRTLTDFKWADCKINEKDFVFDIFPVSSLPKNPAAKIQAVRSLVQEGVIKDRGSMLRLLDFPDLKDELNSVTATEELVRFQVNQMLAKGIYTPPDEYTNLQFAISHGVAQLAETLMQEKPSEHVGLLYQYLDAVTGKIKQITDAQAQAAQATQPPQPAQG